MLLLKKSGIRYDEEFKAHAVRMVIDQKRPASEVATDLGVPAPTIRRWVKESKKHESPTSKRLIELEAQNRQLKKKLQNAEDTIDVLKKSVAIFVNPQKK